MIRTAAGVVLLLTSLTLTAQNGSNSGAAAGRAAGAEVLSLPGGGTLIIQSSAISTATCPVGMHATHGVWDHTINVRNGDKPHPPQPFGQRISLTLTDAHHGRVLTATVRVRGLNGKDRMVETVGTTQDWNAVRTLTVSFSTQTDGSVTGDLWIPGFTSVSSIELVEVSYADGSTWKKTGSNVCSVQPDPFMLITSR